MALKKVFFLSLLVCGCFIITTSTGCAPKKTVKQVEEPAPKPEPTPPPPPTDSFDKADLDAEFQRKVAENLLTVYFAFDSYALNNEAKDRIRRAANFLQQYPELRIVLEGHCDERGSAEYNMGLGVNRANAVKNYLINLGVKASMLETTSWGKERPVTYNCGQDDTCHGKNRRVEYKVIR